MTNGLELQNSSAAYPAIPVVCHFCWGLWDDGPMPDRFREAVGQWGRQGWKVRIWQRAEMMELLHQHPDVLAICQILPRRVQWADLLRYLIIYEHGGLYSDLDCHPTPDASLLAFVQDCITTKCHSMFLVESELTEAYVEERCQRYLYVTRGVPEPRVQFGNFLFASIRRNPLILEILWTALDRCRQHPVPVDDFDVLHTSGPHVLSTVVHRSPAGVSKSTPYERFAWHRCTGTWRNYSLCSACS